MPMFGQSLKISNYEKIANVLNIFYGDYDDEEEEETFWTNLKKGASTTFGGTLKNSKE